MGAGHFTDSMGGQPQDVMTAWEWKYKGKISTSNSGKKAPTGLIDHIKTVGKKIVSYLDDKMVFTVVGKKYRNLQQPRSKWKVPKLPE